MLTEWEFSLDVRKLWKAGCMKNAGGQRSAGTGAQRHCGFSLSRGFQDKARQCQGWRLAVAQLFELNDYRGTSKQHFYKCTFWWLKGSICLVSPCIFLEWILLTIWQCFVHAEHEKADLVYCGMFVLNINLSYYWHFVWNLCSRKLPVSFSRHPWESWRGCTRIFNSRNCSFKHKWELVLQVVLIPIP